MTNPAPNPSLPLAVLRSVTPGLIGVAMAAVLHLFIAPHIDALYAKILLDIGVNIILAVSLNIVNGMTGQFSIGHAGFMAVGGYTAAGITYYGSLALYGSSIAAGGIFSTLGNPLDSAAPIFASGDMLFVGALFAAGIVAALVGVVVGLPSLRLRGDYLAIVTLGFGEIVRVLIEQSQPQIMSASAAAAVPPLERLGHVGGALGMSGVPFYTTQFWVYAAVVATLITAFRLRQSTYGRAFFSIRENAIAAEAMGVPVTRYKVSAFVIAAFFAGIAGGLFAHQVGVTLNPGELGFQKSFDILIMVVLGGLGSISGAVLAAILLTILPELLRDPPHVWPAGLLVVLIVLAVRRGKGLRAVAWLIGITAALEIGRSIAVANEVDLSKYRMIFYAMALVLMMILRPRGLLGAQEIWEQWPLNRLFGRKPARGAKP